MLITFFISPANSASLGFSQNYSLNKKYFTVMGILAWKVYLLIRIDIECAVSNAEDFGDFSEDMIGDFFEGFGEVFSSDAGLVVLIIS